MVGKREGGREEERRGGGREEGKGRRAWPDLWTFLLRQVYMCHIRRLGGNITKCLCFLNCLNI